MKKKGNIVSYSMDEIKAMIARGEDKTDYDRVVTYDEIEAQIAAVRAARVGQRLHHRDAVVFFRRYEVDVRHDEQRLAAGIAHLRRADVERRHQNRQQRRLRERVERLACGFSLADNYFAWQAFGRSYSGNREGPLPPYLERRHFDAVRARVDRVSVKNRSITEFLAASPSSSMCRSGPPLRRPVLATATPTSSSPTLLSPSAFRPRPTS